MSKAKISIAPSDITKNWTNGMNNSVQKIVTGVNAIQDNPMAKAAAAGQKMAQKVQEAVTSGRHAAACNAVSLQSWKDSTTSKVQARLANGVAAAQTKHQNFANWLVPVINGGLPAIAAMPSMTLQDSIARQTAWTTYMASQRYKK